MPEGGAPRRAPGLSRRQRRAARGKEGAAEGHLRSHHAPHQRHPQLGAVLGDQARTALPEKLGPARGAAASHSAQAARLDSRAHRALEAHRREARPGHGLDTGADRPIPRLRQGRLALRAVAKLHLPRPPPRQDGRTALDGGQPRCPLATDLPADRRGGVRAVRRSTEGQQRAHPVPEPGVRGQPRRLSPKQEKQRQEWGDAYLESGRVWTHENGEALHPDRISRRFTRLVELFGLPTVRLHGLRHLAAALSLFAEHDIKVVQEKLGHSPRQITSDTHTSVLPEMLRPRQSRSWPSSPATSPSRCAPR